MIYDNEMKYCSTCIHAVTISFTHRTKTEFEVVQIPRAAQNKTGNVATQCNKPQLWYWRCAMPLMRFRENCLVENAVRKVLLHERRLWIVYERCASVHFGGPIGSVVCELSSCDSASCVVFRFQCVCGCGYEQDINDVVPTARFMYALVVVVSGWDQ